MNLDEEKQALRMKVPTPYWVFPVVFIVGMVAGGIVRGWFV